MLGSLFRPKDRIANFWQWIVENEALLAEVGAGKQNTVKKLFSQLRRVRKGLTFEISDDQDSERILVISADGDLSLFSTVRQVVDRAPNLPGWQVVAFRQPSDEVHAIEIQGLKLDIDSILYESIVVDSKLCVQPYIKGFRKTKNGEFDVALFILLDALIGEYDVATKLQVHPPLPLLSRDFGFKPLRFLRQELVETLAE